MLKADYIYESPEINVKTHGYAHPNVLDVQIGEVEYALSEADAKELHGELDKKLYRETRESLEEQIEELNDNIYDLKAEIEDLKSHIADLEEISMQ